MANRVMLVEDEIIVAMDVQQRLEKLEYEIVAHAVTGEEAVRLANETHPDLILMDIKLRGPMDGIDAAARIRATLDVPVIYLTAFADENTVKRARLTEAFGYLIKPFEDRELHSAIEIALYKHSTERKLRQQSEALRVSEERYALATRATNDGIWDWNLQTNQIYFSPRWKEMLGYPEDTIEPRTSEWFQRVHPEDIERLQLAIDAHLQRRSPNMECEYRILHQDGGYRWILCRGLALFNADGKPFRMAGSQSDITGRKAMEEQLTHKALHDDLTGLANRALFLDRLGLVFERSKRNPDKYAAVLFLDVDHFKTINDSLGHVTGDQLLTQISHRLEGCLRDHDTVARFGGDEFAILAEGIECEDDAVQIARRIQEALKQPFSLSGQEIYSTASIGIVFTTNNYRSVEDLLRDADTAMYSAKYNGRACFEIFDARMHERTIARLQLESDLRKALENQEFVLYYQPIISIEKKKLTGVEALIRWQHPTRGLLPPAEFIASAEETGLIIPIGEWVLRAACVQLRAWHNAGFKDLHVSVNLSGHQFKEKELATMVQQILAETGLESEALELEVTESVAMQDVERTIEILKSFHQMGIKVSIDDFGSGYSSLDHLKRFPVNILKIDRSFIHDMQKNDFAIVQAMIQMAHQLNLIVIAEGVEEEEQFEQLVSLTCDRVQGYLIGRPVPAETLGKCLNKTD